MSEYNIQKTTSGISVMRDGIPVRLEVLSPFATPTFGLGDYSESSLNLAYAILFDFVGQAEALLSYEAFTHEFLKTSKNAITIRCTEIEEFIAMRAQSQYDAQDIIRNMKKKPLN